MELSVEQFIWMMQHHNEIADAYFKEDMQALRDLAATAEYKSTFGDMSFDMAYDIYDEAILDDPKTGVWAGLKDVFAGRTIPYDPNDGFVDED